MVLILVQLDQYMEPKLEPSLSDKDPSLAHFKTIFNLTLAGSIFCMAPEILDGSQSDPFSSDVYRFIFLLNFITFIIDSWLVLAFLCTNLQRAQYHIFFLLLFVFFLFILLICPFFLDLRRQYEAVTYHLTLINQRISRKKLERCGGSYPETALKEIQVTDLSWLMLLQDYQQSMKPCKVSFSISF